jgi:hypothetical protein
LRRKGKRARRWEGRCALWKAAVESKGGWPH